MSYRNKGITSVILIALIYLLFLSSVSLAAAQASLAVNQLVTSGQTVTLQAPSGDYYYQWTAVTGGATIGLGSAQKFSFSAPLVSQDEGSKAVTISLFIRTKEGGCVNQTSTDINVYSLPVCGISGPAQVGPYETAAYSYTGGTTGKTTFVWNVDGKNIDGATGPNVNIDWTQYNPVNHTIGMTLTRDYSDVAPGSTNPFRSISCTFRTNVTYTTGLQVVKTVSATTASVGQAVTYSYTVQNTGTIGINSLVLKDDKLGEIKLDTNTLMPGVQATGTSTYIIKESDLPGPLNNTAVASGVEDRTKKPVVSATASATVALTYNAALNLTKVPSSTTAKVGDTVTYRFTVTNTGNVTIKDLNLTDDKLGTIKTDKKELAPGAIASASATHVILESDLPGPLTNLATIQGTDSQGKPVTATATASVALTYTSGLVVTKTPSSNTAKVGDTVTYQFSVKNNGSVTINGLALNDDKLGVITLNRNSLPPGETATGSATHLVVETDLPGPLTNVATATGADSQGVAVTGQATALVQLTYTATLQVTKTPSATTANVGDTVTYQFAVKNTGSVTINSLALNDDKLGAVTLDKTSLAPGDTANGSATHTVIETDLPGPLTNVATVTGTDRQGVAVTGQATASVKLTYTAALQVTKTPSASTAAIGETVTYQFAVKNTGNVTINTLTLTDDKLGAITLNTALLAPGETATGSATHTVIETDLPGPLTNVATAKGTDSQKKPVTATAKATVTLTYTSSMSVTKVPSRTTAAVGDKVTYTYTVNNTGSITINKLSLSDDKLGAVTTAKTTLAPGESTIGTITYTVLETDLPGPLTNVATAKGTDSLNQPVTATATATVTLTYTASMSVTKVPSRTAAAVGDKVTYTYTVSNTGNVTLSGLTLSDNKVGAIKPAKTTLASGETTTGTATYTVLETDLPGPLTNIVTVSATDSQKQPVTGQATATVTLTYTASMSVTKVPSSTTAAVGDKVTYTYTVSNTGNVTLSGLTLSDNKVGTITPAKTTLASGETTTGTGTYTVLETDLPGPLTNIVTVAATDSQKQPVTGQATATVTLTYITKLEVAKVPSVKTAAVGGTITYSYTVKNSGTVTINGLTMTDDKLGTITLDKNTLAPGANANGSATHVVIEADLPGPLTNIVTVSGTDSQRNAASATATATVTLTYTSSISLAKTATSTSSLWIAGKGAKLGDDIVYTYVVSNTGTTTVSAIGVIDDKLGQVALDRSTLAPGEKATGTLTHKVVQEDMGEELSSTIANTATSSGTSIGKPIQSPAATVTAGVYRDAISPTMDCVSLNADGTYTAFFGYSNTNGVAVSLSLGKNNQFTPPPDDMGQPTTFEPGSQTAVFAVESKGDALVWHLDGTIAEANKNSGGCSQASCGLDGPAALCKNKEEIYSYTAKEESQFKQSYDWFMDDTSLGSGKSITISGSKFEMGDHKLRVKVNRDYKEKLWSSKECSMAVKVIPEPSADISMEGEES
ncbi:MAG: hypothetical protein M0Q43_01725 [Methanothrix sp.]|jgi:uncharacterized repeat protein (TIGR01451 family)|nr:hypothetical protein [Methanothrix sp.]